MGAKARIILTRSPERNRAWAEQLRQDGHEFLLFPLIEHDALTWADQYAGEAYDWLMFTSPTGVEHFVTGVNALPHQRVAALGTGTEAALVAAGWTVDFCPPALDGAELARAFMASYDKPLSILLPGPKDRLAEPRASLAAAGYSVTELALYQTRSVVQKSDLRDDDVVFFCSPSAVHSFVAARSDRPACVAIGETTAAVCRAENFAPQVATTPELAAMMRAAGLTN